MTNCILKISLLSHDFLLLQIICGVNIWKSLISNIIHSFSRWKKNQIHCAFMVLHNLRWMKIIKSTGDIMTYLCFSWYLVMFKEMKKFLIYFFVVSHQQKRCIRYRRQMPLFILIRLNSLNSLNAKAAMMATLAFNG